MSLAVLADHLASKGRNGDTMLVHMTPEEVHGLHALALAHGGQLTINPETGLPEANFLKKLLPMIAGMALNFIAPGVGTAIGGLFGASGAVGTGLLVGGITGLATGSLKQGIMAGLGAYGGASLIGGLQTAGIAGAQEAALSNIPKDAIERAAESGLSEQALRNQIATKATQDFMAKSAFDRFGAGVSALGSEAGRTAALQGVGGASGLMRAGLMGMAGADALGQPQTTTQMPGSGFQYPPRVRPMSWNQYTGQLEQLPMFSAINTGGKTAGVPGMTPAPQEQQPPGGYNTGGIVALANGGTFGSDPTQQATPTAAQLAAQQSIVADPQAAALAAARSGIAAGMTNEQIANMVNTQYGKSFSAQNVADFMAAHNITRPAPVVKPPVSEATDVTFGGDTITPTYTAPQPQVTLGDAFQPTAPTMSEITTQYEQGGGSTRMPTITDIKPGERTYTQNETVNLLRGYLQTNPNALYGDVQKFAASRGIPEMQARAAYNEFRFDTMTGGTKQAYDYLMGRAPYSTKPFVPGGGPIMRPYAEAVGLAAPGTAGGEFYGRKTIPTSPTDKTAQSTTGGKSTTSSAVTGGKSTTSSGKGNTTTDNTVDTTRSTDAATVGGVVVGNNVIDPISGRVIGVVTANVDQGTGGIIQGDVVVDPITGKIIGYSEDAGLVARLVNKKIGEEPAPIESRYVPSDTAYYDFGQGDIGGYGGSYTQDEMDMLAGMRRGGLADVAAAAARGGNVQQYNLGGYSDGGRLLRGPGDGVSDSIPATIGNKQPARLADGEFVIPARIVSEIGNGSTEAGARKLYAMMDRVQRARAKTTGKGKVAKNTRADKYLPA